MRASVDRLLDGAAQAGRRCAAAASGCTPDGALAIAVSGLGRRLALGPRAAEELRAALVALPPGTRQVGYYGCGEIAPLGAGPAELRGQSLALTVLGESS
jgi:hypothetical protein